MINREKLIKQIFIGKVAEIIGHQKTLQLLKESTMAIDDAIDSKKVEP